MSPETYLRDAMILQNIYRKQKSIQTACNIWQDEYHLMFIILTSSTPQKERKKGFSFFRLHKQHDWYLINVKEGCLDCRTYVLSEKRNKRYHMGTNKKERWFHLISTIEDILSSKVPKPENFNL